MTLTEYSEAVESVDGNAYERMMDALSRNQQRPDETYTGDDGLQWCAKCRTPVQVVAEVPELKIRKVVNCACKCCFAKAEAEEERKRQEERERNRRICFTETNMDRWNFANDDHKNQRMSEAMKNYADRFAEFRKIGKGLLLFGDVGTGKTYFAACIANALIDKDYKVLMTNFAELAYQIEGRYNAKQEFIDSLNRYDLLVVDDLGVERDSASGYMQEMVYIILDSRYRAGLPFIVTTNLTAEQLKNPADIRYKRIYERILERCIPLEVKGESRRRQALRDTHAEMMAMLGL